MMVCTKDFSLKVTDTVPALDWTKLLVLISPPYPNIYTDPGQTASFTPMSGDMHIFSATAHVVASPYGFVTIDVKGSLIGYTGPATNCRIDTTWTRGTSDPGDCTAWIKFTHGDGSAWFQMDFGDAVPTGPYSHNFTMPSGEVTPVSMGIQIQITTGTPVFASSATWALSGNIHNV